MRYQRSFPLSEGVRGITAMAIVVVHVWLVTETYGTDLISRMVIRLDACVAIFFALSAFLLYRPMIAHRAGGARGPTTSEYARRRFFRIYPTYWFTLTAIAIFPGLVGVFGPGWWAYYSLAANWIPEYSSAFCYGGLELCGLPQTWTLTTEMSFYIMLPGFAWMTARLWDRGGRRVRRELALIAALAAASLSLHVLPGFPSDSLWFLFSFLAHFDWLGLGLALALVSVALERRPEQPAAVRLVAGRPGLCYLGALAIYSVMVVSLPPVPFPLEPDDLNYLAMHVGHLLMATLILLPVVFGDPNRGASRRFLGHPAAVWLGLVSYGIYLWHFSVAYELGSGGARGGFGEVFALTLAISIPLAAFSWYAIEKPLMRLKYGRRKSPEARAPYRAPSRSRSEHR
jgi:peptidoglycan/LPS O-acetylase OafA/YrhL